MEPQVLVVCKADRQLVSLDPGSLEVRWRAALSDVGHEVVASVDGRLAYVPLYGTGGVGLPGRSGDGLDVVDLQLGARVDTIPLPPNCRPHFADWAGEGTLLVTAEGIHSVLSVYLTTYTAKRGGRSRPDIRELPTGHPQSHMLAIPRDGSRVYTADVNPGRVTEITLASSERRILELAAQVNRISLSTSGKAAYVGDQNEPRLAVVDTRSMTVDRWIPLPGIAFGTAALRDGRLLVALRQAAQVILLDAKTGTVHGAVSVPQGPQRVALADDEQTAYVTCSPGDAVVAIDLAELRMSSTCTPGRDPDGIAIQN